MSVSPQLENGYTRLANELLEAIIKYPFGKRSLKIVLVIIRETYGWNVKKKVISYGKMAAKTLIERRHIPDICNILIASNILFRQKLKNNKNIWGINKNYEEWLMPDNKTLFREYEFQSEGKPKEFQSDWQKIWIRNKFPELTEILKEEIQNLLKKYGEEKFIEAFKIAVKQNNKKLAYIEGILKRKESGEGSAGDATNKTQISNGKWLTDEELAQAEMEGKIYYERKTNKWICVPKK